MQLQGATTVSPPRVPEIACVGGTFAFLLNTECMNQAFRPYRVPRCQGTIPWRYEQAAQGWSAYWPSRMLGGRVVSARPFSPRRFRRQGIVRELVGVHVGRNSSGARRKAQGVCSMMDAAPNRKDDAQLMRGIQAGNEDALAALYDRYGGLLYTFALRICGQSSQAEEVLQDVFSTVWRAASHWKPERGSVQAWLVTMTRHRAIDALRSNVRRASLPLTIDLESDQAGPEEIAVQHIMGHEVRKALGELPHRYREILEAVYFTGLSGREAASKFGLPYGTVRSRIRLAIERLARLLRARGIDR